MRGHQTLNSCHFTGLKLKNIGIHIHQVGFVFVFFLRVPFIVPL